MKSVKKTCSKVLTFLEKNTLFLITFFKSDFGGAFTFGVKARLYVCFFTFWKKVKKSEKKGHFFLMKYRVSKCPKIGFLKHASVFDFLKFIFFDRKCYGFFKKLKNPLLIGMFLTVVSKGDQKCLKKKDPKWVIFQKVSLFDFWKKRVD